MEVSLRQLATRRIQLLEPPQGKATANAARSIANASGISAGGVADATESLSHGSAFDDAGPGSSGHSESPPRCPDPQHILQRELALRRATGFLEIAAGDAGGVNSGTGPPRGSDSDDAADAADSAGAAERKRDDELSSSSEGDRRKLPHQPAQHKHETSQQQHHIGIL